MRFASRAALVSLFAFAALTPIGAGAAQQPGAPPPASAPIQPAPDKLLPQQQAFKALIPDAKSIPFVLDKDIPWRGTEGRSQQYYLVGDAQTPGKPYVLLLKWYPGNYSRPHLHPNDRYIQVLSGTWWVSSSTVYDPEKTFPMPAGTFVVNKAGEVHWDGAKNEPTVLLITGIGPASQTQVDEKGVPIPRAAGGGGGGN